MRPVKVSDPGRGPGIDWNSSHVFVEVTEGGGKRSDKKMESAWLERDISRRECLGEGKKTFGRP